MCWGSGKGDEADRRGSEFNIDWKGVDCGVSTGSQAVVDSDGASVSVSLMSMGVWVSIWIPLAGAGASCGIAVGRDRGCVVVVVLILWWSAAGVSSGVVAMGEVGVAFKEVSAGGVEPEGSRGRLAAWASSVEETSLLGAGMAWKQSRIRNVHDAHVSLGCSWTN